MPILRGASGHIALVHPSAGINEYEPEEFQGRIGRDVWHNHYPALLSARAANKSAGRKVKRIAVRNGHFIIVDV